MQKKTIKIISNLLLFGAFILTYFLDLTGLELHQYIGVGAGLLLIVHVITHASWIKQVSQRFYKKVSQKVRLYFLLDISLLVLILVMIGSGILISTWILVNIDIYPIMRDIHILSSIAGLGLLTIKLVLHWKFFSKLFTVKRVSRQAGQSGGALQSTPRRVYTRRDAIKTIGALSAVGVFGLYKAISALKISNISSTNLPDPEITTALLETEADQTTPSIEGDQSVLDSEQASQDGGRRRRRGQGNSENESIQSNDDSAQNAPQDLNNVFQPTPTTIQQPGQECVVRCPRACAFPGECGHYIDENHNKLCDLGECLVV